MDSEPLLKAGGGEESMSRMKAFLVFPAAALYFAIMPGRVGTNELVSDPQVSGSFLKKGLDIPSADFGKDNLSCWIAKTSAPGYNICNWKEG